MEFNWLGVAFVSESIPNYTEVENEVDAEMERLQDEAKEKFDAWLAERGLEQVMGVIVQKGSIK